MLDSLGALTQIGNALSAATSDPIAYAEKVAADPTQATSPTTQNWFGVNGSRIVVILLGLLLVAAGIFQFDKVQQVAGAAVKTAAAA